MAFCTNCGYKLEEDASFCANCNSRVKGSKRKSAPSRHSSSENEIKPVAESNIIYELEESVIHVPTNSSVEKKYSKKKFNDKPRIIP